MSADTSGPAFPCRDDALTYAGMTLRDYFAAKAMQGMLAAIDASDRRWMQTQRGYDAATKIAEGAYVAADAMLKARQP
jgi:hypothetical protein